MYANLVCKESTSSVLRYWPRRWLPILLISTCQGTSDPSKLLQYLPVATTKALNVFNTSAEWCMYWTMTKPLITVLLRCKESPSPHIQPSVLIAQRSFPTLHCCFSFVKGHFGHTVPQYTVQVYIRGWIVG